MKLMRLAALMPHVILVLRMTMKDEPGAVRLIEHSVSAKHNVVPMSLSFV